MKPLDRIFSLNFSGFEKDINNNIGEIKKIIENGRFLVIGGAGSIGQSVSKEILKRNPRLLHVIDINENNLVELVRDIRSSLGYLKGEFKTFVIDILSDEFSNALDKLGPYDYILNLSAIKHVRSEKDPHTLLRMINVNILSTISLLKKAEEMKAKKYFSVSTDKASNPVNMMGASKRIMELFLFEKSDMLDISTARFANVAFSDGSLLHSFHQRFLKKQPIAAPYDIERYFINSKEAGELCLLACILGKNRDIFFPKLNSELKLISFTEIAKRFLKERGFEVHLCSSEEEAREDINKYIKNKRWPCLFFESDTTGEKKFEEFFSSDDLLDLDSFQSIGIIKNLYCSNKESLESFLQKLNFLKNSNNFNKKDFVKLFSEILPDFKHLEKDKYLDEKM